MNQSRRVTLAVLWLSAIGPAAASPAAPGGGETTANGPCGEVGIYPTRDLKSPSGGKWQRGRMFLVSSANANDRYTLFVRMEGSRGRNEPDKLLLCLPGRIISTGSGGGDNTAWGFEFAGLDRATADEIARLFHLVRQDRRRLGEGLAWHYRLAATDPRPGDPLPIVLTVENRGRETVVFTDGGGHRGSDRENRFRFRVFRDGVLLPDIGSPENFGGKAGYVELPPGQARSLRPVDLKKWGAFDRPGSYEVHCAYDLDLTPSTETSWEKASERWDLPAEEIIRVEILCPLCPVATPCPSAPLPAASPLVPFRPPSASSIPRLGDPGPVPLTILITPTGLQLDGEPVDDARLVAAIRKATAKALDVLVIIVVDPAVVWERVMRVMDAIHSTGASNFAFGIRAAAP